MGRKGTKDNNSLDAAVLHDFAVLQSTNVQLGGIRNQAARHEDRAKGTGAVKALAVAPLALGEL